MWKSDPPLGRSVGLDVARSGAIVMVLLSHCGDVFASWWGGQAPFRLALSGFFGVELFFVLSGFLIGRLLLRIVADGPTPQAWSVFIARRWMRTLPPYFLWLVVLALFWPPRFWEPGHGALTLSHALRWATLTQNLAWPMPDGWYGVSWSLAVEEWFYLGFSAPLFVAVALLGRRAGIWLALGVFLTVPPLLRWFVADSADFNEVLSKIVVLRLDAIAFGVALAAIAARCALPFRHPRIALACGLLLIAGIWTSWLDRLIPLEAHLRRTILFDIASLGFALCLPAAAALRRLPHPLGAVFGAISRQSYAIYLTHLSILEFAGYYRDRWHLPAWLTVVGSLLLIWAVSWASWRWIEAPILARRPRQPAGPEPAGAVAHASSG